MVARVAVGVWRRCGEERVCGSRAVSRRGVCVLVRSQGFDRDRVADADLWCAVAAFRQHARWDYIARMSLPTAIGVVIGWALMNRLSESAV